jgi:DNA-binding transcriptional LysR family regulator
MDLRGLRHVVMLARKLSYTKAAEELGLSQSALSRSIQAIERRGNVRLFDRDRGGVQVTAVGREFVERAAELLREADELDLLLRRCGAGGQGNIAFGMTPLHAAVLSPGALSECLQSTPTLRSRVYVRSADALLSLLTREEIEFVVATDSQIPHTAPVDAALLGAFPISLLVRAGHPLLVGQDRREASDFPLIASAPFERGEHGAAPPGEPHILLEDLGALARITESSDAIWLSSSFAAAEAIMEGRIRELPPERGRGAGEFRVVMYSLSRRSLSPAALRLRELFREKIRTLSTALAQPEGGSGGTPT